MESGKNKLTTKQQFEKLVELMEKHPETARGKPQFGCSKNKIKELWEQFAVELNSLGPPSRTAHEWGRVWIHYKANLKRKLSNNRNNYTATGGGPSQEISLNPLEESVAQLIQTKEQIAPGGSSFGADNIEPVINDKEMGDNSADTSPVVRESQVANSERPTSTASAIKARRKSQNLEIERLELLKTQAETQKKLLRKIEQMEKTLYKNFEVNKKMLDIKQQKLDIYKRQAKEAHELHTLKVEVEKLKIVEMGGTLQNDRIEDN